MVDASLWPELEIPFMCHLKFDICFKTCSLWRNFVKLCDYSLTDRVNLSWKLDSVRNKSISSLCVLVSWVSQVLWMWLFVGRGFKSHAYTHSVQESHHVFLNLETMKFYCLPDNYQIIDQSLEDIVVSSSVFDFVASCQDFGWQSEFLRAECGARW